MGLEAGFDFPGGMQSDALSLTLPTGIQLAINRLSGAAMADLKTLTQRIQQLGEQAPTESSRKEMEGYLSLKWEGVQAAAIKALGAWGDRKSFETIKAFLLPLFERERGWSVRGVAIQTLGPLITAEDADWVLDLYFQLHYSEFLPGIGGPKGEMMLLVAELPMDQARDRLFAALRDPDWENRNAAIKAIANMGYPNRKELFAPLCDDINPVVRGSALFFMEHYYPNSGNG